MKKKKKKKYVKSIFKKNSKKKISFENNENQIKPLKFTTLNVLIILLST